MADEAHGEDLERHLCREDCHKDVVEGVVDSCLVLVAEEILVFDREKNTVEHNEEENDSFEDSALDHVERHDAERKMRSEDEERRKSEAPSVFRLCEGRFPKRSSQLG